MGPINLRYHVISLAAVFLAMGVGIIVGSNTNVFGFSALIERQERVISRLEGNYKEIRKEIKETKASLAAELQYRKDIDETIVPKLLSGKLDGMRVGLVMLGQSQSDAGDEAFVAKLKAAGVATGYKMNISLQRLDQMSKSAGGAFISGLASELAGGAEAGLIFTPSLVKEGLVQEGNFDQPVDAVVFYINKDQDLHLMRELLAPLEEAISAGPAFAVNAGSEDIETFRNIFKGKNLRYYTGVGDLKGQVEAISGMSEMRARKKELETNDN